MVFYGLVWSCILWYSILLYSLVWYGIVCSPPPSVRNQFLLLWIASCSWHPDCSLSTALSTVLRTLLKLLLAPRLLRLLLLLALATCPGQHSRIPELSIECTVADAITVLYTVADAMELQMQLYYATCHGTMLHQIFYILHHFHNHHHTYHWWIS